MKKITLLVLAVFICAIYTKTNAQTLQSPIYKNAAGLSVEFGTGGTVVGPEAKHFFDLHNAFQTGLMFGDGATVISTFYTYNGDITNANGLNYFIGIGPALTFVSASTQNETPSQTLFFLRPTAGLDYKISETPLDLTFDWRPSFYVGTGSKFIPARFGIGLRFCF